MRSLGFGNSESGAADVFSTSSHCTAATASLLGSPGIHATTTLPRILPANPLTPRLWEASIARRCSFRKRRETKKLRLQSELIRAGLLTMLPKRRTSAIFRGLLHFQPIVRTDQITASFDGGRKEATRHIRSSQRTASSKLHVGTLQASGVPPT